MTGENGKQITNIISNFTDQLIIMLRQLAPHRPLDTAPVSQLTIVTKYDGRAESLHILKRLITDPLNTWYFVVNTDEMDQFGIKKGMLLVVDRSEEPCGGMIVVARQKDKWLLRQLISHVDRQYLSTGKEQEPFLELSEAAGIVIWGVVTWTCLPMIDHAEFSEY